MTTYQRRTSNHVSINESLLMLDEWYQSIDQMILMSNSICYSYTINTNDYKGMTRITHAR